MKQELFEAVDHYISDLFHDQTEDILAAEKAIEDSGIPQISVSPNQGKLLHIFAKLCSAKKILELGTLGGYSAIWMAKALPKNGKLITLEFEPKHAAVAQKNIDNAGLSGIIEIKIGKALDILPQLVDQKAGPFDMIFIDADKPPYTEYFEWALKLSRPGTLIIADNVIRDGKVLEKSNDERVQGAQRFNKALAENKAVTATIMQTIGVKEFDGMGIAIVN